MKATFFLSVVALAARVTFVVAQPPACLLKAVNTQDNPSDMSAVCGDSATDVQSAIANLCSGDNASAAQSAFVATCSAAGKSVASYTASASASQTGDFTYMTSVYDSECGCTQTIMTTANSAPASATGTARVTAANSGSPSASRTSSSGPAISTAGAAQQKMGGYAAAAIALVGAVAAL